MAKKKENKTTDIKSLDFQTRESYNVARTNIIYSILKRGCKKIVFTSANKGEGKTVTSTNIAFALAQQLNTKVLIVDCDLRRPHVHSAMGITPTPGLTNYLNGECTLEDAMKNTSSDNLKAICFGAIPPNPSELLASEVMKNFIKDIEYRFDYIIFDTPPVGVVIDAIPIIEASDGAVLVVRNDSTTYPEAKRTLDLLKRSNARVLGVIVNRIKPETSKKYGNYKYGY